MQHLSCLTVLGLSLFFSVLPAFGSELSGMQLPKTLGIGISQIVEHPALDAVREGLLESLKEQGFEPDKNLIVHYENAQGNLVTAAQIASKLLSTPLEVIVAISTPSAQTVLSAAKRSNKKVPIVFAAVSDPITAKLEPIEAHYPITGVTDSPDLKALLKVMLALLPGVKTIGTVYNSSEPNSVATITQLKALLKAQGIELREVTVNSTGGIAQAIQSLVGKVEAVYLPQDNTVISAIETIVNITNPAESVLRGLPLFCSDPLLVKQGVLAAVGYDYKEVGREAGKVVGELLKGKSIQSIPIHSPSQLKVIINKGVAQKLKITISSKLLSLEQSKMLLTVE